MKIASKLTIDELQDQLKIFERKYGWSTSEFLSEFENGKVGDDDNFFKWYVFAMAMKDWQTSKKKQGEIRRKYICEKSLLSELG